MVQKQKATKQDLLSFVAGLSEEQVSKLIEHLPLLKQAAVMNDAELTYTETLVGKLFAREGVC